MHTITSTIKIQLHTYIHKDTYTHDYSWEHLGLKSIGSRTKTLAVNQSRRRQIWAAITAIAITGLPCLSKPYTSQIYHNDFENESQALTLTTAGCRKFRTKVKAMVLISETISAH